MVDQHLRMVTLQDSDGKHMEVSPLFKIKLQKNSPVFLCVIESLCHKQVPIPVVSAAAVNTLR